MHSNENRTKLNIKIRINCKMNSLKIKIGQKYIVYSLREKIGPKLGQNT